MLYTLLNAHVRDRKYKGKLRIEVGYRDAPALVYKVASKSLSLKIKGLDRSMEV